MSKGNTTSRVTAITELRAGFAELYNELRRRCHEVIVEYDDPADPFYIPQIIEVDGLSPRHFNLRFFVEPFYVSDIRGYRGFHWGVMYLPTNLARTSFCQKKKERSQRLSKNQMTGSALADWAEALLIVEQRCCALSEKNRSKWRGLRSKEECFAENY